MPHSPHLTIQLVFTCLLREFVLASGLAATNQFNIDKASGTSSVSVAAGISKWLGVVDSGASAEHLEKWLWLVGIGFTLLGASGKKLWVAHSEVLPPCHAQGEQAIMVHSSLDLWPVHVGGW